MPNFDDKYSELLVECGGNLVPFLDSVFGFLYRRSDFFQVKSDSQVDSVVGFHPGDNKKLLMSVMNKWEKFSKEESEKNYKLSQADIPVAVNEEEVTASSFPESTKLKNVKESSSLPSQKEVESELVNGANQGTYKWSQTESDLEIIVPVDEMVLKGNQVKISCTKNSIKVVSNGQVILDGILDSEIRPSDLIWNLMPGSHILINLEKAKEGPLWPKLLQNEELKTNLSYDKPFTELRNDDKLAVEYAMSQQAQKDQSDRKLEKLLKDAWDKEGSPFRGQPFDPSVITNMQTK